MKEQHLHKSHCGFVGPQPKVRAGVVWLSVTLVLLILILPLGACGCSQQEEKEAPTDTAPAENEGEPSVNALETNQDQGMKDHIFDAKTAKVGDKILGMEITDLCVHDIDEKVYLARVKFSGQATVSGRYTHEKEDNEMLGCQIRFEVDKEYDLSLPREKTDTRVLWFVFSNHDEAEELLGPPGSSGMATVVIDEYRINLVPSCEYNTAKLVRVVEKR